MLTFEEFRVKLADAVTVALLKGKRVGGYGSDAQCCPMGCLPGTGGGFPTARECQRLGLQLSFAQIVAFQSAMDGSRYWKSVADSEPQFRNLGRLYRERFSR